MTTEQREPLYASTAKPWLKYYDQKYIDMPLPKCSAFEYLCHQNKNHLSETALEYYGRKFTFADLFVNVKKTAAAFRALGVKKGDIITVVSVMTPEVIYAFYAVDMIGATLNLVDPRYSVEGIHEYIEEVDSRLLICLNVTYERCHKAEKRTNVERVLVISPADSLPLHLAVGYKLTNPDKNRYKSNVIHWKDFIAQGKDQSMNAEPYDPQHACVVVHTGGTTGSPKGVMLTDDCFNSLAHEFIAQSNLFCRGQKLMNVMPPFIAYGYACGVHMPLVMGLHVVIIPNLDPDKLGALIWKHKPEHMFGALLCGLVYHKTKNILATMVGEVFGTSILGGLCAYPVAIFLMGKSAGDIAFYAYIVPFLISTAVGSIIAGVLVYSLQRSGALRSMQNSLS